jgi:monovalent cation:H+ antiporter, CPA1 family
VIAVVAAGLTLNLTGPGRLSPQAWTNLREVWDLLAHWAGALIFVLAALLIPRSSSEVRPSDFLLILVVIAAAIAARVVMLFGLLPLLTAPARLAGRRTALPRRDPLGGLRGAVTLALALAVTESFRRPGRGQAAGRHPRHGLHALHADRAGDDAALGDLEARARPAVAARPGAVEPGDRRRAPDRARGRGRRRRENYDLTRDIVRSEAKRFAERLDEAVEAAEENAEILDRDRITLGLIALAGRGARHDPRPASASGRSRAAGRAAAADADR